MTTVVKSGFPKNGDKHAFGSSGLTKRELLAAMAMQGLLANPNIHAVIGDITADTAMAARGYADALLAALAEPSKEEQRDD